VGYGIAALGTGSLLDAGIGLPEIFGATAVIALVMGALSFMLARNRDGIMSAARGTDA
jgi:hypothetical protein